ncbi:tRNA-dihydrouridine synthase B [bacterium BMS3Abin04]|nr:tRNA-dihydrouridine synthase B [bacterium BMS3Abin04]
MVKIPVVLNGGIFTAEDVKRAFDETDADAVMIARGAINHPWIFKEAKELLIDGEISTKITPEIRIKTALKHLKYELEIKEVRRAVIPFRKFYSGYLKGLYGASKIRQELYQYEEYEPIEEVLLNYLKEIQKYEETAKENLV